MKTKIADSLMWEPVPKPEQALHAILITSAVVIGIALLVQSVGKKAPPVSDKRNVATVIGPEPMEARLGRNTFLSK